MPKDEKANLAFRRELVRMGAASKANARELWKMCSRDMLFWLNAFCWVYEPRLPEAPVLPFITWVFQDKALLTIEEAIGEHDLCVLKSRDMTATWDCIAAFTWRWQFREMQTFLAVSRNEDLVYKRDDPDTLFWKMLFLLERQPAFLRPRYSQGDLRLSNDDLGSTINGASTTGNVGRGGRRTAALLDEFASFRTGEDFAALNATQPVTNSRIINSTPHGTGNAYEAVTKNPKIPQLLLHWSMHPLKSKGLYRASPEGKIETLDPLYDYSGYAFLRHPGGYKQLRSPWYDSECEKAVLGQKIAEELDIDFLGSSYTFFSKPLIDEHERLYSALPIGEGEIEDGVFTKRQGGRLKLWCQVEQGGKVVPGKSYVVGADVSAGTGASNSCLVALDASTGEQVAELATPHLAPHEFAEVAASLGEWLSSGEREALIVSESNGGHNRLFNKALIELHYGNLFYRRDESVMGGKISEVPGWGSTKDNKRELLENAARALSASDLTVRSTLTLQELREYVFFPDGTIGHVASRTSQDPSGARENHGDRAMAVALAWHGIGPKAARKAAEPCVPVGCFAYRRMQRQAREREEALW